MVEYQTNGYLYIDIGGVLLDYKAGEPAEHAEELIRFITSGQRHLCLLALIREDELLNVISFIRNHGKG